MGHHPYSPRVSLSPSLRASRGSRPGISPQSPAGRGSGTPGCSPSLRFAYLSRCLLRCCLYLLPEPDWRLRRFFRFPPSPLPPPLPPPPPEPAPGARACLILRCCDTHAGSTSGPPRPSGARSRVPHSPLAPAAKPPTALASANSSRLVFLLPDELPDRRPGPQLCVAGGASLSDSELYASLLPSTESPSP